MSTQYTSRERRQKNLKYAAIILAAVLVVSTALLLVRIWENRQSQFPEHNSGSVSETLEYNGEKYILKDGLETVLVLGLDKFNGSVSESYNNDMQADFLMLLVIDHNNSSCTALHINRDTMAEMAILGVAGDKVGTVTKQIALAHTYGNGKEVSCRNTAEAVSDLLMNIDIDHYISVTMDAVSVFNDFVGGVEVTVLDDFGGVDETLIKGETVTLMGEHALNYVRTRYGLDDSTNSQRMIRQRQYIEALYRKTVSVMKNDESFIVNAGLKLSDYIISDYSGNALENLAKKIEGYTFNEIRDIDGETVKGEVHMEFYPSEDSVKETVVSLFYKLKV